MGYSQAFCFTRKNITSDWLAPYRLLLAGIFVTWFFICEDKNKIFAIVKNKERFKRYYNFWNFWNDGNTIYLFYDNSAF